MYMLIGGLIALIVLVGIHEFGHYFAARCFGVKVLKFYVGFGTPLLRWTGKSGTEFGFAAIPLGGYVKMVDEREGNVAEEDLPYAFTRKPVWQRIVVYAAGPVANLLLAIVLFGAVALPGQNELIPVIGSVEEESIAARAGLESGQEILSVDGVATPSWQAVQLQLIKRLGETGSIEFVYRYSATEPSYTSRAEIDNWLRGADEPDPLGGIGIRPRGLPAVVASVVEGFPAAEAGLLVGDEVVEAEGEPIGSWGELVGIISASPEREMELVVLRDGVERTLYVVPKTVSDERGTRGQIGVTVLEQWPAEWARHRKYGFAEAVVKGMNTTGDTVALVLSSVKKLIFGQISTKNLSGPITIAKVAGSSAEAGWISFVSFMALLSVSLGVFNLLPIPPLDGGHIAYLTVESVKGSPLSERAQMVGLQLGVALVLGVMVLAIYNDVVRLFTPAS